MTREGRTLVVINLLNTTVLDIVSGKTHEALRKTHGLEVSEGVLPLKILTGGVPIQLLGHKVDDIGEGLEGSLGVQEGQTGAASDDIDSSLGVFVADGVTDFTVDEGVHGRETASTDGETLAGRGGQGSDLP